MTRSGTITGIWCTACYRRRPGHVHPCPDCCCPEYSLTELPQRMPRLCRWCRGLIRDASRSDAIFCGVRCRQASHRFAVCPARAQATDRPMRFAYADPPYPGHAAKYPEKTEVDYPALIRRLQLEYTDGWALSVSARSTHDVWQHCPEARLCIWVRPLRKVKTRTVLSGYESLLVSGGRLASESRITSTSDVLIYRGRHRAFPGAVVGMKPPAFSEWMFRQLGAAPGDTLDDLFPGSGAVTEAWRRYTDPEKTVAMKAVARDVEDDG